MVIKSNIQKYYSLDINTLLLSYEFLVIVVWLNKSLPNSAVNLYGK